MIYFLFAQFVDNFELHFPSVVHLFIRFSLHRLDFYVRLLFRLSIHVANLLTFLSIKTFDVDRCFRLHSMLFFFAVFSLLLFIFFVRIFFIRFPSVFTLSCSDTAVIGKNDDHPYSEANRVSNGNENATATIGVCGMNDGGCFTVRTRLGKYSAFFYFSLKQREAMEE